MNTTGTGQERRQHKRYDIASGGFALLRSSDAEVLGSIRDISAGGLSLSHIDDDEGIREDSRLDINLISEKICFKKLHGRNVWSKRETSYFATSKIKMKCCGIAFEQLNEDMQDQLSQFIVSLKKK